MAGSTDGEDENYWPGYVDALTTMTMVLTFILMVLGIVVFSMSQSVSRAYLEAIADAARVEGGSKSKSVADLQNAIIEKLLSASKERETQTPEAQSYAVSGLEATAAKARSDRTENTAVDNPENKRLVADAAQGGPARVTLAEKDPVAYARPTGGGVAEESNTLSGTRQSVALSETKRDEDTTRRTGAGEGGAAASGTAPTGLASVNETRAGVPGGDEKALLPPTGRQVGDSPGARPANPLLPDAVANVLVPETTRDGSFRFALALPLPGATGAPEADAPDPASLAQATSPTQEAARAGERGGAVAVARLDAAPATSPAASSSKGGGSVALQPAAPSAGTAAPKPPAEPASAPGLDADAPVAAGAAPQGSPVASGSSPAVSAAAASNPAPAAAGGAEAPADPAPTPGAGAQVAAVMPPQRPLAGLSRSGEPAGVPSPGVPSPSAAGDTQAAPAGPGPAHEAPATGAPEPALQAPAQAVAAADVPLPRPRPSRASAGQAGPADAASAEEAAAALTAPGTGGPGRGTAAQAGEEAKDGPGPNRSASRSAIIRGSEPDVGPAYAALLPEEKPTDSPRSGGVSEEGTSTVGVPLSRKAPIQPKESEMLETTLPAQARKVGVGAQVTTSGATLTIRFLPKAINLSERDRGALKLALLDERLKSANEVRIDGVATVSDGFSDERRSTFFRMMVVRNELVKSGFPADKIRLQLIESLDRTEANFVKIYIVQ